MGKEAAVAIDRFCSDAVELGLVKHTGATGGVIVIDGSTGYRLTPIQFDLISVLWERLCEERERHEAVRGYVSSCELLCSLPWDTAHPDIAHLKQLIRRVRRRLVSIGVGVEACCGLGYRLVVPPRVLPAQLRSIPAEE